MERADEVLRLGEVTSRLSARRGVDHRKKRCRNVDPADAAHPRGRGKTREVARHAAAHGHGEVVACKPGTQERAPDRLDSCKRFCGFARCDYGAERFYAGGAERGLHAVAVERIRICVAHHHGAFAEAERCGLLAQTGNEITARKHKRRYVARVDAPGAEQRFGRLGERFWSARGNIKTTREARVVGRAARHELFEGCVVAGERTRTRCVVDAVAERLERAGEA